MKFDIIIVGAGLSGSYLAKKVHKLGLNVLIIEKSKSINNHNIIIFNIIVKLVTLK